ncbi:MAG: SH3 domain-containing protein [Hyphomicrobiales bacterium]|nr:MAG: SH3 domain-containing protein [Hyphomicrobiales bacterium]
MLRPEALAAGLAVVLLSAPAVRAQSEGVAPAPGGQVACSFGAFVSETDPAGLNVRAGPGTNHKVVGTLPPVKLSGDDPPVRAMVEVEVSAGANGWFRIAKARDNEMLTDAAPRPMFKGSGWVSGRKLTVKSQAAAGRLRPDAKAPAVLSGQDGLSLDGDAFVQSGRLLGCSGKWVQVEYGPFPADGEAVSGLTIAPAAKAGAEAGRFRAWVDRICATQETSCDGG